MRAAWQVMVSGELCAKKRLVFVDEMDSNTSLLHELLYASLPERRPKSVLLGGAQSWQEHTTRLLWSMSLPSLGWVLRDGARGRRENGAVFETYLLSGCSCPRWGKGRRW